MPSLTTILAGVLELLLIAGGGIVLWRIALSPVARRRSAPVRLGPWPVRPVDFMIFIWAILIGGFVAQVAYVSFAGSIEGDDDARRLMAGFAFQVGMLAGCISLKFLPRSGPAGDSAARAPNPAIAGFLTFLVIMPLVTVAGIAWQAVLQTLGLPAEPQSLVGLVSDSQPRALLVALTVFAVVIAPVTEELIFRAGLFRFLRTRVPRLVALLGPAALFASLHVNWTTLDGLAAFGPLVMLGALFSLSYERTGSIAVPMIAHGLFNANTLILIFAGVPTEF